MVRKIVHIVAVLGLGVSAALVVSMAFLPIYQQALATHVGGAAHADIVHEISTPYLGIGCPCPQAWQTVSSNPVSSASQREKLESVTVWLEGYDDVDSRLKNPSGSYYYGVALPPRIYELIIVSNPPGGTWTYYTRQYSVSPLDASGAAADRAFTFAYETTPLP